eukprot:TRINITY_DN822_c0_g1_i1.p1 TRINITY_DN822_c0_g1~~TRINITY_DN822_c0_g1_i1.p1  ORF type:complete len:2963 (-),score=696.06 TRINITY_DN822_c0_g1_i1:234-9122(-)
MSGVVPSTAWQRRLRVLKPHIPAGVRSDPNVRQSTSDFVEQVLEQRPSEADLDFLLSRSDEWPSASRNNGSDSVSSPANRGSSTTVLEAAGSASPAVLPEKGLERDASFSSPTHAALRSVGVSAPNRNVGFSSSPEPGADGATASLPSASFTATAPVGGRHVMLSRNGRHGRRNPDKFGSGSMSPGSMHGTSSFGPGGDARVAAPDDGTQTSKGLADGPSWADDGDKGRWPFDNLEWKPLQEKGPNGQTMLRPEGTREPGESIHTLHGDLQGQFKDGQRAAVEGWVLPDNDGRHRPYHRTFAERPKPQGRPPYDPSISTKGMPPRWRLFPRAPKEGEPPLGSLDSVGVKEYGKPLVEFCGEMAGAALDFDPRYLILTKDHAFSMQRPSDHHHLWRPAAAFLAMLDRDEQVHEIKSGRGHYDFPGAGRLQQCVGLPNVKLRRQLIDYNEDMKKQTVEVSGASIAWYAAHVDPSLDLTTGRVKKKGYNVQDLEKFSYRNGDQGLDKADPPGKESVVIEPDLRNYYGDEKFRITRGEVCDLAQTVRFTTGRYLPRPFFAELFRFLSRDEDIQFYYDRRAVPLKEFASIRCSLQRMILSLSDHDAADTATVLAAYGFVDRDHVDETLQQSFTELSTNAAITQEGYFFVGRGNQIAEKGRNRITFVAAPGIDFNSGAAARREMTKYFSRHEWLKEGRMRMKDRVKETYYLMFNALQEHKVKDPTGIAMGLGMFLPPIEQEDVKKIYQEAQFELLEEFDFGFDTYWLNAGPAHAQAVELLDKEQYRFKCNVVIHGKDGKGLCLELSKTRMTSFLNPSDAIAMMQGRMGYWWEVGYGERFVGEEDFASLTTGLLASVNILLPFLHRIGSESHRGRSGVAAAADAMAVSGPATGDTVVDEAMSAWRHLLSIIRNVREWKPTSVECVSEFPFWVHRCVPPLGVRCQVVIPAGAVEGPKEKVAVRIGTVLWLDSWRNLPHIQGVAADLRAFGVRVYATDDPHFLIDRLKNQHPDDLITCVIVGVFDSTTSSNPPGLTSHDAPRNRDGSLARPDGCPPPGAPARRVAQSAEEALERHRRWGPSGTPPSSVFTTVELVKLLAQIRTIVPDRSTSVASRAPSFRSDDAQSYHGLTDRERMAGHIAEALNLRRADFRAHGGFNVLVASHAALDSEMVSALHTVGCDRIVYNLHLEHAYDILSTLAQASFRGEALVESVQRGRVDVARALLFHGADPAFIPIARAPVHVVADSYRSIGHEHAVEFIRMLTSRVENLSGHAEGAPAETFDVCVDRSALPSLRHAARMRNLDALAARTKVAVGRHESGSTALHMSVRNRSPHLVELLLRSEADVIRDLLRDGATKKDELMRRAGSQQLDDPLSVRAEGTAAARPMTPFDLAVYYERETRTSTSAHALCRQVLQVFLDFAVADAASVDPLGYVFALPDGSSSPYSSAVSASPQLVDVVANDLRQACIGPVDEAAARRLENAYRRHQRSTFNTLLWVSTGPCLNDCTQAMRHALGAAKGLDVREVSFDDLEGNPTFHTPPLDHPATQAFLQRVEDAVITGGGPGMLRLVCVVVELGAPTRAQLRLWERTCVLISQLLLLHGASVDLLENGAVTYERPETTFAATGASFLPSEEVPIPSLAMQSPHARSQEISRRLTEGLHGQGRNQGWFKEYEKDAENCLTGPCPWVQIVRYVPRGGQNVSLDASAQLYFVAGASDPSEASGKAAAEVYDEEVAVIVNSAARTLRAARDALTRRGGAGGSDPTSQELPTLRRLVQRPFAGQPVFVEVDVAELQESRFWFLSETSSKRATFGESTVTSPPVKNRTVDYNATVLEGQPMQAENVLLSEIVRHVTHWLWDCRGIVSSRQRIPYDGAQSYAIEHAYTEGRPFINIIVRPFTSKKEWSGVHTPGFSSEKYTIDLNRLVQYRDTYRERHIFREPLQCFDVKSRLLECTYLIHEIRRSNCVLFVGAGFVKPAFGPTWGELLRSLADTLLQEVNDEERRRQASSNRASPAAGGGAAVAKIRHRLNDVGGPMDEPTGGAASCDLDRSPRSCPAAAPLAPTDHMHPSHSTPRDKELMPKAISVLGDEVRRLTASAHKEDYELAAQLLEDRFRVWEERHGSGKVAGPGSKMQREIAKLANNQLPRPHMMEALYRNTGYNAFNVMVNRMRMVACSRYDALLTTNYSTELCTCESQGTCAVCKGRTPMYEQSHSKPKSVRGRAGVSAAAHGDSPVDSSRRDPRYMDILRQASRNPAATSLLAASHLSVEHKPVVQIHGTASQDGSFADSIVFTREGYRKLLHERKLYAEFLRSVMASRTILYVGFSFTDDYLNELRSDVMTMKDFEDPLGYAIINDRPLVHVQYFREHEGVEMLTWCTRSFGFGVADRYMEGILRLSDVGASLSHALVVLMVDEGDGVREIGGASSHLDPSTVTEFTHLLLRLRAEERSRAFALMPERFRKPRVVQKPSPADVETLLKEDDAFIRSFAILPGDLQLACAATLRADRRLLDGPVRQALAAISDEDVERMLGLANGDVDGTHNNNTLGAIVHDVTARCSRRVSGHVVTNMSALGSEVPWSLVGCPLDRCAGAHARARRSPCEPATDGPFPDITVAEAATGHGTVVDAVLALRHLLCARVWDHGLPADVISGIFDFASDPSLGATVAAARERQGESAAENADVTAGSVGDAATMDASFTTPDLQAFRSVGFGSWLKEPTANDYAAVRASFVDEDAWPHSEPSTVIAAAHIRVRDYCRTHSVGTGVQTFARVMACFDVAAETEVLAAERNVPSSVVEAALADVLRAWEFANARLSAFRIPTAHEELLECLWSPLSALKPTAGQPTLVVVLAPRPAKAMEAEGVLDEALREVRQQVQLQRHEGEPDRASAVASDIPPQLKRHGAVSSDDDNPERAETLGEKGRKLLLAYLEVQRWDYLYDQMRRRYYAWPNVTWAATTEATLWEMCVCGGESMHTGCIS